MTGVNLLTKNMIAFHNRSDFKKVSKTFIFGERLKIHNLNMKQYAHSYQS